ncbi:hypothetical protein BDN70DRAFT_620379 [Pholiota conissans]|uniref:Uncharacterized protein n=1 Tax=Pholiota conissans TaxID=109636 RepID=A0A9P5YNA3_9AGAR|nr:hypothetical protein BDN70DRAFT_620379 [Pholiota conissans]
MRRPITIHVATQRTSWTYPGEESGEGRDRSGNVRVCLPPLSSPSASCSEDSHDEAVNDTRKTPMQDKWASRRASTSTLSTDGDGDSAFNANANIKGTLGLPPPLTPIESDVEVMPRQHRTSAQVDGDVDADADDVYRPWSAEWGSSEESGRHKYAERERGSLGGITIVEGFRAVSDKSEGKGGMGLISQARWVFAWILGAQLGALGAWGCALALGLQRIEDGADGMRVGEMLEIVHAVFVVLAVCGSMGAYFGEWNFTCSDFSVFLFFLSSSLSLLSLIPFFSPLFLISCPLCFFFLSFWSSILRPS